MHKLFNVIIVWEYGRMGIWEKRPLPHTHTPTLPHHIQP